MTDAQASIPETLAIEYRWLEELTEDPRNTRTHTDEQIDAVGRSIAEFGWTSPILIDEADQIIAGHARKAGAVRRGIERGPTITLRGLTPEQKRAYLIADNRLAERGSGWDIDLLRSELTALDAAGFDLTLTGFDSIGSIDTLGAIGGLPGGSNAAGGDGSTSGALAERFGIPPFSVLNAREGWWQDRKRAWIGLGIKSELGRGEGATYGEADQITEPGLNHYRNKNRAEQPTLKDGSLTVGLSMQAYGQNRKKRTAKAFADGAIKGAGKGGLADQVAAAATARGKRKKAPA